MINAEMIRSLADSRAYSKGRQLYNRDAVMDMDIENTNTTDVVTAWVKGSYGNFYTAYAIIDKKSGTVDEIDCECPAFASYQGICKHCVAMLLKYQNSIDRQIKIEEYLQHKQKGSGYQNKISKGMKVKTTADMKELLEKRAVRHSLPVLGKNMCREVVIEPILSIENGNAGVEFRIGEKKMYVLKNVFAFGKHLEKQESYAYGKQLEFIHTLEVFQENSKKLAEFILEWTKKNRESYSRAGNPYLYHNRFSGGELEPPALRRMPLHARDFEKFLDAVGQREFLAAIDQTGEKMWQVSEEVFTRKIWINGKEKGISIKLENVKGYLSDTQHLFFSDSKIYRVDAINFNEVSDFIECMNQQSDLTCFIEKSDVPSFCRDLLPQLKEKFECIIEGFEESEYGILLPEFRIYLDMPQKDMVTCRAVAVYGGKEYEIYDRYKDIGQRELEKEAEVGAVLSEYCNSYDEEKYMMVLYEDEEMLYELLTEGIGRLQEMAEVYVSDALKKIQIVKSPKAGIGVSLSGDLLELRITSGEMSMSQLAEILSRYDRKKKFHRLKNGDFIQMEDGQFQTLAKMHKTLQLTDKQLRQEVIRLPKYRALYLDAQLKENPALEAQKSKSFRALIRNMKTIEDNDFEIPKSLEKVLRGYQKQGYLWIKTLCSNGFGGILADDMGLGKTLQVIAFLLSEREEHPGENRRTLIVCPASLVYNWKSEIERFAPDIPVDMVIGTVQERKQIIQESEKAVFVTSYDLLRRDITEYEDMHFFCEIIDEAQYIKNHNTQSAKAVKLIDAGFKLALTGTPVENRLSELHSIFDYLMPGFLYSYKRFREEIEIPVVQNGEEEVMERLKKMITPFILRRLKKEVLKDLPDKLEENMYVQLQGEQQKLYDAHVKRMQLMLENTTDEEFKNSKIQILSELTRLRQICCSPALLFENYAGESAKMEMCLNLIENAVENQHKILLFSQFTTMLEQIQEELNKRNIPYYTLTGATKKERRAEMVEAFQKDDIPVFCISLKAGGTGLNLTAADIVIHYDPWWNIAVQNQATDRAHRIGQKNTVNVYKLIAKGTIEENIVTLQERKRELADKILSGEQISGAGFNREELIELLGN